MSGSEDRRKRPVYRLLDDATHLSEVRRHPEYRDYGVYSFVSPFEEAEFMLHHSDPRPSRFNPGLYIGEMDNGTGERI